MRSYRIATTVVRDSAHASLRQARLGYYQMRSEMTIFLVVARRFDVSGVNDPGGGAWGADRDRAYRKAIASSILEF